MRTFTGSGDISSFTRRSIRRQHYSGSRHICSRTGTTFARCRSCSAILMSAANRAGIHREFPSRIDWRYDRCRLWSLHRRRPFTAAGPRRTTPSAANRRELAVSEGPASLSLPRHSDANCHEGDSDVGRERGAANAGARRIGVVGHLIHIRGVATFSSHVPVRRWPPTAQGPHAAGGHSPARGSP